MFDFFKSIHKQAWDQKNEIVIKRIQRKPRLVGVPDHKGDSLLTIAANCLSVELAEELLKAGADPNFVNPHERFCRSPLHIVTSHPYITLYGRRKAPEDALREMTELLLRHGADPNIGQSQGDPSPMEAAVQNNLIDVVKLLLKAGGNVHKAHFNAKKPTIQATYYREVPRGQECSEMGRILRKWLKERFDWDSLQ